MHQLQNAARPQPVARKQPNAWCLFDMHDDQNANISFRVARTLNPKP